MRNLRPEEEWARRLISNALGVPVDQHDDGTADGMHDLDIRYDGSTAAVEVTAAADGESIALWRLMNSSDRWIEPTLQGGWMVSLLPDARGKTIKKNLPELLGMLEAANTKELVTSGSRRHASTLSTYAHSLGITGARQSGTDFPGSIYITLTLAADRTGGFVAGTGDALALWLGPFLDHEDRRDVLAKLERSGADERHAFILFPGFADAPFAVTDLLMRSDAPLPIADPSLPDEVTHVWAAGTWTTGRGMRWDSKHGWSSFETST